MGAWEATTLDNDTAADYIGNLPRHSSWNVIASSLAALVRLKDGDESQDIMFDALAAAEIVAAALGRPTDSGFISSRETIAQWVESHPLGEGEALIPALAGSAVSRLSVPGVEDADAVDEWQRSYAGLSARLAWREGDAAPAPGITPEAYRKLWLSLAASCPGAALALLSVTSDRARSLVTPEVVRASMPIRPVASLDEETSAAFPALAKVKVKSRKRAP